MDVKTIDRVCSYGFGCDHDAEIERKCSGWRRVFGKGT